MQHRGVVLASDLRADGRQRAVGDELAAQIHRNLACLHYLTLAALGKKVVPGDVEIFADGLLHLVDADVALLLSDDLLYDIRSDADGIAVGMYGAMGYDGDESSFKLTEIGLYLRGEEFL